MHAVRIVLITCNNAPTIRQCLRGIMRQTYAAFEVRIVDNGSTDRTLDALAEAAAHDPRLAICGLAPSTSLLTLTNELLAESPTEFVLLLAPDLELAPNYLANALAVMRYQPQLGMLEGVLTDGSSRTGSAHATQLVAPLFRQQLIAQAQPPGQFLPLNQPWPSTERVALAEAEALGWRLRTEPACWATRWGTRAARPHPTPLPLAESRRARRPRSVAGLRAFARLWHPIVAHFSNLISFPEAAARLTLWHHRRRRLAARRQARAQASQGWLPTTTEPMAPLLSICVPTYQRPALLARALRSLGPLPPDVEVLVSDNEATGSGARAVVQAVLADQPATQWRYVQNGPGGTLISNWNQCVQRARGHYILMLHDDDFLLPGGVLTMVRTLRRTQGQRAAVLFGVQVVDEHEQYLRRQLASREEFLAPGPALQKLLSNSSFVRIAGMVVSRQAYFEAGLLREEQQGTGDTDLWVRVCGRHGLLQIPVCTAAYTIHEGAQTASMFNRHTIEQLQRIFGRVRAADLLSEASLRRAESQFFHQFILAGTYRSLRRFDLASARKVMQLFSLPSLQHLSVPVRWRPVRVLFGLITQVPVVLPALSASVRSSQV